MKALETRKFIAICFLFSFFILLGTAVMYICVCAHLCSILSLSCLETQAATKTQKYYANI